MLKDSPQKTEYEEVFEDFDSRIKDQKRSPCEQLDDMRRTMVTLQQIKNKTWRSWCFRDWPCLFTQHRDNIDRRCEQLAPVQRRLERECELHMQNCLVQQVVQSNGGTRSDAEARSSSNSVNAQRDYVHRQEVHVTIPNTPKP
jgi:hypothetical protein